MKKLLAQVLTLTTDSRKRLHTLRLSNREGQLGKFQAEERQVLGI